MWSDNIRTMAIAILVNVIVTMILFVLVKAFLGPPLESLIGIAIWLIPVIAHFFYLHSVSILQKFTVSIVGTILALIGAFAIAVGIFGDAP